MSTPAEQQARVASELARELSFHQGDDGTLRVFAGDRPASQDLTNTLALVMNEPDWNEHLKWLCRLYEAGRWAGRLER